jgi:hypothetical protein
MNAGLPITYVELQRLADLTEEYITVRNALLESQSRFEELRALTRRILEVGCVDEGQRFPVVDPHTRTLQRMLEELTLLADCTEKLRLQAPKTPCEPT